MSMLLRLVLPAEFKADSPDRLNIIPAAGGAELFSEVADMDFQGTFHTVRRFLTQSVKNRRLRKHLDVYKRQVF